MDNLRPCHCCDCQHYDPLNDEAPEGCGHPDAPLPWAASGDARDCPGFNPEPYALAMEFLPLGGAIDVN
ncbi:MULTISPECIES: hypothetical protein [Cyanophyceae]|uniref:hypothetical protein n=1 Tax=Cyanophyceae TaxID=3028117 RepID=UPI001684A77D|nr:MULTISPECIES: hypothetical protein [Cyanophyceae]MBD1917430.1 hypothetical protein [Phormidium sp. FACHB-77]MBD2032325.1 hypothetical protein [Phormidium sp. FACHB-322]MBD2052263.1 hypothetical protein [Leptolyngbya sp. FACHB-60]